MIISKVNNNYIIKILGEEIDVYSHEQLENITKRIVEKIIDKNILNNLILLEFYFDKNYGMIVKLKDYNSPFVLSNDKTVKIIVHTDTPFLYKIDYFDIKDNELDKENIYYYKNCFYLEIKNDISKRDYLNILELSEVIYEETFDIIDKGIKI